MCDLAHVEGRCPSAPGEALIDPLMLKTIRGQVGDQIQVVYTALRRQRQAGQGVHGRLHDRRHLHHRRPGRPEWFNPAARPATAACARRPLGQERAAASRPACWSTSRRSPSPPRRSLAPTGRSTSTSSTSPRWTPPSAAWLTWQAEVAGEGPPVIQPDDVVIARERLRGGDRGADPAVAGDPGGRRPAVVLALLLLYVLIASAAEVRRQEVALAKLRGFSTRKVVRFAVAEPAAVLLLDGPGGHRARGRSLERMVAAHLARLDAVRGHAAGRRLGGRRDRRRAGGGVRGRARRGARAAGGLAGLGDAGARSDLALVAARPGRAGDAVGGRRRPDRHLRRHPVVELRGAAGAAVRGARRLGAGDGPHRSGRPGLAAPDRATRGGLSPFLASRRLVRRQDLVQLVLPLLLATAMATFAASAWKVADDWRVSKAAATIGAADRLLHRHLAPRGCSG